MTPGQLEIFGEAPEYMCFFDKWLDTYLYDYYLYASYASEINWVGLSQWDQRFPFWLYQSSSFFASTKDNDYLNGMSLDPTFADMYSPSIAIKASNTLSQLVNFGRIISTDSFEQVMDPEVRKNCIAHIRRLRHHHGRHHWCNWWLEENNG